MFRRVGIAIVGTGRMASMMAETIAVTSGVKNYAVVSRDEEKARKFAEEHGISKAFGSYEEALSDRKVKLVYIAAPHTEHYRLAKLAIEHGKHVLCEKPFVMNRGQAEELFALAEKKKVLAAEAMWTRYMPFLTEIREVLDSHVIGDPVMLTARTGDNSRWVKRMTDPELGGGTLMDIGVYPLNFASMLFGDDVTAIQAACTHTSTGVDEQDSITLKYRDGRIAVLTATMLGISDNEGCVVGTKGCAVVENIRTLESLSVYNDKHVKIGYYKAPRRKTGYEYELQACVRALKNGWLECPAMPHAETLAMLQQTDEIRRQCGIVYPGEPGYQAPCPPETAADEIREKGSSPEITAAKDSCDADYPAEAASLEGPSELSDVEAVSRDDSPLNGAEAQEKDGAHLPEQKDVAEPQYAGAESECECSGTRADAARMDEKGGMDTPGAAGSAD